jgi:hypothetical protein
MYVCMYVCMYVNKLMSEPDLRRPYYRCKYPILRKYVRCEIIGSSSIRIDYAYWVVPVCMYA